MTKLIEPTTDKRWDSPTVRRKREQVERVVERRRACTLHHPSEVAGQGVDFLRDDGGLHAEAGVSGALVLMVERSGRTIVSNPHVVCTRAALWPLGKTVSRVTFAA